MPKLVFHIASDWEEVVKLRNEIAKLKQELKSMDSTQSPAAFKALNTQLAASSQRMDELVTNAAKAGAVIDGDFKKKIFDASQTVNGFTEKIIAQKAVVKDVEADVKRLGDAYRTALKRNPMSANGKLEEYKAAKNALDEEKAALFGLTQQQAEARLSVKKLRDEYALYNQEGKKVTETNNGMAISWKKALAVIGGVAALKRLGSEIIRVRGELQSMQTAIETMVGKNTAGKIMPQIKELAKISPLTMSDMVGAEKMMLGFNIQAEDTIKYLKAISDISMGESGKFNSLTLAFSQMSAAGRLLGNDLNQFINAGFNPLQQIAEKTGKSIAILKDEMSKGAISAEMVQQAFIDATSAGGKFYNMSENASKTINGQISMMQDALDATFNEMGQKSEGVIMKGIQTTTSLIQNYETIGKVLLGLITTYGIYKAGLLIALAVEQGTTKAIWAKISATKAATIAQAAFNKVAKANPYVLLASLAIGAATAMYMFSKRATEAQEVQRRYNASKEVAIRKEEEHRQEIQRLINVASDEAEATVNRNGAIEALKKGYPGIIEKYIDEEGHLTNLIQLQKELNEEQSKRKVEDNQTKLASINDKVRNQEEYVSRMSGSKEAIKEANGVLKELQRQQKEAQSAVNADYINARLEEAKKLSDDELRKFISQWESTFDKVTGDMIGEFSRDEVSSFIKSLETLQSAREKLAKNKSYWEKQKKEANAALESIASTQKKLMDAGKFEGVDAATVKNYKNNIKKLKEAEKELKVYDSFSKQENQAEKLRKQQEKYKSLLDKQSLEQKRSAEDLQMKVDEARIKAMDEGSAKTIAEMELNFEKEMQAVDRQKEDALRKKIDDARSVWEANPENKGKSFDATGIELSDDERKYYDELYKLTIANNEKSYSELANQYLSYTDQRLAIEKKFNDDVAILQEARKKAEERGDVNEVAKIDRSIEKRTEIKNEDVFKLDAEEFKKSMNWEQVFGDLDKVSTDTLKKLKANLKDFISAQKDLSPENLKELVDAIERIDDKVSERNPFEAMSTSFKSLKDATDEEHEAQKAYNKALKEGTDEEKKNAKATLESAKNNKQRALSEATTALHKGVDEIGQYVDAGNQVIGIMETLGVKTPEWLGGYMEGMGEMLNGLSNIDLTKPMSIVTGSLQTIKGALTSITSLGGVINWNGSNAKEVQDSINRLTDRNEALQTSIESLTDEIKASKGTKSVAAYKDAYEYQKEQDANYLNIAHEQARYHGSHKSWQHYMKWSKDDIGWIQQNVNENFTGTDSLWGLTPEEMEKIRSNVDIWTKMQNAGKGGYGRRVTEKLDAYIEQAGKLEELTDALYEGLTGISFDSMYDSFIDNLMDMKYDAKAAAEDISEYFMRAMLSNKIGEMYSDKLEDWWKKFGASMEDNELTETERNDLQDEYMKYVEEAMKLRDELAAATGYDKISQESSSQSATSKGFQAMSQDTGEELNGRFTALQIAGEEIRNQNIAQSQSLNLLTAKADTILSVNTETKNIADETRDLIASSYLELVQISENTGNSAKYLKDIKTDIAEVKKNTSRL